MGSLLSSMTVFVPCDRKLQRAHLKSKFYNCRNSRELIGLFVFSVNMRTDTRIFNLCDT